MKVRGILLARIVETLFLVGVIVTVEKTEHGLSWTFLALNFDFTFGIVRAGSATLFSTRLLGYLASLGATVSHAGKKRDGLVYVSLALAAIGVVSILTETMRATGLSGISVQCECSAVMVIVDWLLYARLRYVHVLPTPPSAASPQNPGGVSGT